MDFKTEFPDYVAIEQIVKRARVERSLHLGELLAGFIVAVRAAVKAFMDRKPLEGSRIPWGPDDQLPGKPVARDRAVPTG
ncbi:MAG: hypothetical protein OEX21_01780 [Betaproteobacteria bacterium]|nr:hypothetical protein [Betaproteobacteria bacterium]